MLSALSLSLYGFGSAFGNSDEIKGCVNKKTGVLRVANKCSKDERRIAWNSMGLQGVQGDKGAIGEVGPIGLQGITGPQGIQGQKGDKGDVGPIGPQGEKGERGENGLKGDTGLQGAKGDTGAQGPRGEKGETGLQGVQGLQGPKGDTGSTPVFRTRQVSYIFWENVPIALSGKWQEGPVLQPINNYSSPQCPGGTLTYAGIPAIWTLEGTSNERIALSCTLLVYAP